MNRDEILRLALECKHEEGSIDIIQLASKADIEVYSYDAPDDFNAEISFISDQNRFEILVNANHSLNRQRFSIAHELAHFVLHVEEIKKLGSLRRLDPAHPEYFPEIEKEADEFGGELLIPEGLLKDHFPEIFDSAQKILTIPKIQEIALKFKVSVLVAAIRLKQFNLKVPYISYSYSS